MLIRNNQIRIGITAMAMAASTLPLFSQTTSKQSANRTAKTEAAQLGNKWIVVEKTNGQKFNPDISIAKTKPETAYIRGAGNAFSTDILQLGEEENKKLDILFDECNTDKEGSSHDALTGLEVDDFTNKIKSAMPDLYNGINNLINETKENPKLERSLADYKKYKNSSNNLERCKEVDALINISRIELGRLDEERFSKKSNRIYNELNREMNVKAATEHNQEPVKLSSDEKVILEKAKEYLSVIPETYRHRISETFMRFAVKHAQGAYSKYDKDIVKDLFRKADGLYFESYYYNDNTIDESILRDSVNKAEREIHNIRRSDGRSTGHFDPGTRKRVK